MTKLEQAEQEYLSAYDAWQTKRNQATTFTVAEAARLNYLAAKKRLEEIEAE